MGKAEKERFVNELVGRLEEAQAVFLTDFTGLKVDEMTELRRQLRQSSGEHLVVKNTLARLAAERMGLGELTAQLVGPTALTVTRTDPVAAAKILVEFTKRVEKPRIKGGVIGRTVVGPEMLVRLASLPSREQLVRRLLDMLRSPLARLQVLCGAPLRRVIGTLAAIHQQRGAHT